MEEIATAGWRKCKTAPRKHVPVRTSSRRLVLPNDRAKHAHLCHRNRQKLLVAQICLKEQSPAWTAFLQSRMPQPGHETARKSKKAKTSHKRRADLASNLSLVGNSVFQPEPIRQRLVMIFDYGTTKINIAFLRLPQDLTLAPQELIDDHEKYVLLVRDWPACPLTRYRGRTTSAVPSEVLVHPLGLETDLANHSFGYQAQMKFRDLNAEELGRYYDNIKARLGPRQLPRPGSREGHAKLQFLRVPLTICLAKAFSHAKTYFTEQWHSSRTQQDLEVFDLSTLDGIYLTRPSCLSQHIIQWFTQCVEDALKYSNFVPEDHRIFDDFRCSFIPEAEAAAHFMISEMEDRFEIRHHGIVLHSGGCTTDGLNFRIVSKSPVRFSVDDRRRYRRGRPNGYRKG